MSLQNARFLAAVPLARMASMASMGIQASTDQSYLNKNS